MNGFVAAENLNYNSNKVGANLQTNANDTGAASSPSKDPHWWDIKASVLMGIVTALIQSELRFCMNIWEVLHPSEDASAAVFPVSIPNVSGVCPVDSLY